jgi:F420-non-reducing hydrogenase iron-sulfur subunit
MSEPASDLREARETVEPFEPRIVAFFCNWCTYTAADLAGISRMQYAPNVRAIRLMCSGRVDPQFVLAAFRNGADGVLIGGCHPGDCHYQEGNYNALRRFELLRLMLRDMGIEDERLRLEWISAAEGDKVQRVCNEMTEQVRALGPLRLTVPSDGHGKASPGATVPELVGQEAR